MAQLSTPPAGRFPIEAVQERAFRAVRLERLLVHAVGRAAHRQRHLGARSELPRHRAVVLGVRGLLAAGHRTGGMGHARLGREPLELAEVPAREIDEVHAHVPHRPMAGLGPVHAPCRGHRFISEARGEVAEVDVKEPPERSRLDHVAKSVQHC